MPNKIAFVFPGQGSQQLGMLSSLARYFPEIKSTFEEASSCLGYDMWELAQEGPIEQLNQTVYTQPVLLTASVALWRLWHAQLGRKPVFLAGHSLGEYTAYTCGGSLTFNSAISLVEKRGRYMQAAVPEGVGAMAAIVGLEHNKVEIICEKACEGDHVSAANYNMPGQVVISGHQTAITRAIHLAKQEGARLAKQIPVSVPAHCRLMKPAARALEEAFHQIHCVAPQIPVVNNVNAEVVKAPNIIKATLVEQLYKPVQWVKTIQWLLTQEVDCFIECGPGQILRGLIKRMVPNSVTVLSIGEYEAFEHALLRE
jgi:[acyl-carrier-protein] S-malonyltransferase